MGYQIASSKIHLFALAMDIIYELSSIVQVEWCSDYIKFSSQDSFKSTQFEFRMNEVIYLDDEDVEESRITHFESREMKDVFKKLKTTSKNKVTPNIHFWTFSIDSETKRLTINFNEEIAVTPIEHIFQPFKSTLFESPSNNIFEVKLSELLHTFLFLCLGNGFFSVTHSKFKKQSVKHRLISCTFAAKPSKMRKLAPEINYGHKLVMKSTSESGEIDIVMNAKIRKTGAENLLYDEKSETDPSSNVIQSHCGTSTYFVVKFVKHFLNSLQYEQKQCFVYLIENQKRCIIEPKGSPFRLILFSQPQERVDHAM
jgi:hypothetical protein